MLLVSLRGKIVKTKFKFHTLANTGNARIVFFFFFLVLNKSLIPTWASWFGLKQAINMFRVKLYFSHTLLIIRYPYTLPILCFKYER